MYTELNKEDNKKLFSFAKWSNYYLFPLLTPVICFSTKFFLNPMAEKNNIQKIQQESNWSHFWEKEIESFVFFYTLIGNSTHIIAGLLYFVSSNNSKSEIEQERKSLNNNSGDITESESRTLVSLPIALGPSRKQIIKNRLKIFGILLLMSIILTLYTIVKGYALMATTIEKRIYFLFFISILNIPILKIPIYIHQKLSLGIAFLGLSFLIIAFVTSNKYFCIDIDILLLVGSIFYSLYLVLAKYLTQNHISPFLCLLLIGILSTFFDILGFMIYSIVRYGDLSCLYDSIISDKFDFDISYYFLTIGYFVDMTVLQVFIMLTVYYYSPALFALSDIISPLFSWLQKCFQSTNQIKEGRKVTYYLFNSLGYLVILVGAIIYNELIICNFWGLNQYTKEFIDKRGKKEVIEDGCIEEEEDENKVEVGDDYIINFDENTDMKNEKELKIKKRKNRYNNV